MGKASTPQKAQERNAKTKAKKAAAPKLKPVKQKARVVRLLRKREPQLVEHTRNILVLKGGSTSQEIADVLRDIMSLSKPNCKQLSNKNPILPFEDINSLEFLCTKNECSLFALGAHTKKRPNNLVLVSAPTTGSHHSRTAACIAHRLRSDLQSFPVLTSSLPFISSFLCTGPAV